MRADSAKRRTIFSEVEKIALYDLPDFDEFQRAEYFAFTPAELAVADWRTVPVERLHSLLQIGYFKAKDAFFNLSSMDVSVEDVTFLLNHYFHADPDVKFRPIRVHEQYAQRSEIAELFGYRLWPETDRPKLTDVAALLAKRDVKATFVLIEILSYLQAKKIVRPRYTTLQTIISHALAAERRRLEYIIVRVLYPSWPPSSRMPRISVIR